MSYERGIVRELEPGRHRVRVELPARGGLLSPWLDVLVRAAHGDREHGLPRLGDQVGCLLDEHGESGCVLGAVYTAEEPPPEGSATRRGWHFSDGGRVEYDRETHTLTIVASGKVHVQGDVQIAGGGSALARADRTDARLDALEQHAAEHTHGSGVGPTTTALQPLTPGESTAAARVTSD